MKRFFKKSIVAVLGWQVRRLRKKHAIKVVAVAGSIGKTSTKFAIAAVLGESRAVRFQRGNYNDPVSIPLVFFGQDMPSLFNPFAWMRTILANELTLRRDYPIDVVVVELGTDGPGQLQEFGRYLRADIGVLTAIAPEHMEFFADLQAVAAEEKFLLDLSEVTFVNKDLCAGFVDDDIPGYGIKQPADYQVTDIAVSHSAMAFTVTEQGTPIISMSHDLVSETQLYSVAAAVAVARKLGMEPDDIKAGIAQVKAVSGRMQRLKGIKDSLIIDETYNASPEAVKAALDTLYGMKAPQKIAILGNMNELGEYSKGAHQDVGDYCEPEQLDLVVTIGPDANAYLAPAAEARGCTVRSFDSPYAAGTFVREQLQPGAAVLAKGSQNRVFAEEAIKQLLADPADASKLVRQAPTWLDKKRKQFEDAQA